jgi:hypothetical protein
MRPIAISRESRSGGIVPGAGSSRDDQENAAGEDRASNLRDDVSGNMFRFKFAAEQQPEGHGWIDMASGYRSDCVSYYQE